METFLDSNFYILNPIYSMSFFLTIVIQLLIVISTPFNQSINSTFFL